MTIISILIAFSVFSCKEAPKDSTITESPGIVQAQVSTLDSAHTLDVNPNIESIQESENKTVDIEKTGLSQDQKNNQIETTPPSVKEIEKESVSVKEPKDSPIVVPTVIKEVTKTAIELEKEIEPEVIKEVLPKVEPPVVSELPKELEKIETKDEMIPVVKFSHEAFNRLLRKYVSDSGNVNYKGLKGEEGVLDSYLGTLKKNPVQKDWSRDKQLAYWINAYNAFTLKLILKNYPLKSITDLHAGKPWDVKWIALGDKTYSLNDIENGIIRPEFNEPRIHFAVNCAAKSCPPLLNSAWTAENLEANLEKQTIAFVNDSSHNEISKDQLVLSKIFDWYGKDFGKLNSFVKKYSRIPFDDKAKISFKEYNWTLNQ